MVIKSLTVQIKEEIMSALDSLVKKSGRKKNLIVSAALYELLASDEQIQEAVIRKFLSSRGD